MKRTINKVLMAAVALMISVNIALGANPAVKQEFRSTWLATVWRLDWPTTVVSSTGNQTQINNQKKELTTLLDSLKINNFNAINFQVRSRCDAMYKSSYEPWSEDLVSKRGLDPGWDPLAFAVEECHKRGMECHAWLNPYRYESVVGAWKGDNDYRKTHPEWLMDVNGASILNPGLPEVTQRICDIVKEIVTNYDIDGVLFDDYFYLSGTKDEMDGHLFEAYKENGGTLTNIKDWRRANVNNMIKQVYNTIQQTKNWVRFGVGPAGIACTDGSVAKKYGIKACPTGSDWQYNDIYSEPVAWYVEQSVDYMAPQVYWTIENESTNYVKAVKWWSEVAAKFNRQMFVSQSISSINSVSEATPFGMSGIEATIAESGSGIKPKASGPHNTNLYEYSKEVKVNREESLDGAPGSMFYSAKYIYRKNYGKGLLGHHLLNEVYTTPALIPAMTHKKSNNPGLVSEIKRTGNTLSWKGYDNVRYAVYAVPESETNFTRQAEYLLGFTYETSYAIPAKKASGHKYAVSVYDRYGYEYSAAFLGEAVKDMAAPTLLSPANGAEVEAPVFFTWSEVKDAILYTIDIADDATFNNLIASISTESTTMSTVDINNLPLDKKLYWRVRASGNNYNDGVSQPWSFTAGMARFTSPANEQSDVELRPTLVWTPADRDVTIQLSNSDAFDRPIYTTDAKGGKHTLPFARAGNTSYYARFLHVKDGVDMASPVTKFTTKSVEPVKPEVISPVDKGSFYGDQTIKVKNTEGAFQVSFFVATSASGLARGSSVKAELGKEESCPIKDIPSSKTFFKNGKTYYFKVRSTFQTPTGPVNMETPAFSAVYLGESGVDGVAGDSDVAIDGNTVRLGGKSGLVEVYSVDGRLAGSYASTGDDVVLDNLESGIYMIRVTTDTVTTLKHKILH